MGHCPLITCSLSAGTLAGTPFGPSTRRPFPLCTPWSSCKWLPMLLRDTGNQLKMWAGGEGEEGPPLRRDTHKCLTTYPREMGASLINHSDSLFDRLGSLINTVCLPQALGHHLLMFCNILADLDLPVIPGPTYPRLCTFFMHQYRVCGPGTPHARG